MNAFGQQVLVVYSAVLSTALGVVLLAGARSAPSRAFDEIRVHRIDVVEPNGTLRLVLSNHASLPGVIVKGKEQPPSDRPQAGMLFYNDEGSENGGLIFGGRLDERGQVVDSGGSLSFDRYGANQIVQLAGVDDKDDRFAGLAIGDRARRIWVGRTADGTASLALMDANGKKRLLMQVTAAGAPSISILDDTGKVVRQLVPRT
jgi:hypothetical protein